MVFKINIGTKDGKTWKLETESKALEGKELGEKIQGNLFSPDLVGYEFEITGASDLAGFPSMPDVEGTPLKKVLLNYGFGMKKRPKHEGKRKRTKNRPKGLRLRKTVRGKVLSEKTTQINLNLVTEGGKKLPEIFPDQMPKTAEPEQVQAKTEAPSEAQ